MTNRDQHDLRHEVKFVGSATRRSSIEGWLLGHQACFRSAYPPRRVNNFYLDDFELSTYEENLTGVSRRTKIRFRWYGESAEEVAGTLELKRKRNRLGWKEHFRVPALRLHGRHYFVSSDGRIRVTLDGNQRVFDQQLAHGPNLRAAANLPDALIVEFKASSRDHLLLGRTIQGIPLRSGRHSKYVVGVQSLTPGG